MIEINHAQAYISLEPEQEQTDTISLYESNYYLHKKSQFEIIPNRYARIVFLGDSITDECEWKELLAHPRVINRGIAGDTTDGVLNRLDQILKFQPEKIFLMIGINDLIKGRSITEVYNFYNRILIEIQKKSPNTRVWIQSVLPINQKRDAYGLNLDNESVKAFNSKLITLAKDFQFTYIDLFSILANEQNQLDEQYTLDGLHLNGQGYLVWKQVIKEFVWN
ncbi:MAG: GDSL-type esterase/lipase family protein [Microcoleaceae cyanobacterium]